MKSQQSKAQSMAGARPKCNGLGPKGDLQQRLQFWVHKFEPITKAKWLAQIPTYGTRIQTQ